MRGTRALDGDVLRYGQVDWEREKEYLVPVTYIALGVVAVFAAGVVAIASVVLLEPVFRPPIEKSDWIPAVFSGVAAVLAGSAGISIGLSADSYSSVTWTQVGAGGLFAVVGIVLTVIGVWIYEPQGDDGAA